MSYEAWGDNDDGHDGCFTEEQVKEHEEEAHDSGLEMAARHLLARATSEQIDAERAA